jgi:hypothetical protein
MFGAPSERKTQVPSTLSGYQSADADDLVKDQLRELLPELLACGSLIGFVKSIDAGDAGEVGYRFEVPDDDVVERAEHEPHDHSSENRQLL